MTHCLIKVNKCALVFQNHSMHEEVMAWTSQSRQTDSCTHIHLTEVPIVTTIPAIHKHSELNVANGVKHQKISTFQVSNISLTKSGTTTTTKQHGVFVMATCHKEQLLSFLDIIHSYECLVENQCRLSHFKSLVLNYSFFFSLLCKLEQIHT